MSDTELMIKLLEQWYKERDRAEQLLTSAFDLQEARAVLKRRPKAELTRIPNTDWYYKTHGAGVLVTKEDETDGIDFDFDAAHPDEWRLDIFLDLQHRAGKLNESYTPLLNDETRRRLAVQKALQQKRINELAS